MGIEDIGKDEFPVDKELTVEELIEMYGEEPVRRGIQYLMSLYKADKNYRESVDEGKMKEGYERGYGVEGSKGKVDDAVGKWGQSMKERGLGINEE